MYNSKRRVATGAGGRPRRRRRRQGPSGAPALVALLQVQPLDFEDSHGLCMTINLVQLKP